MDTKSVRRGKVVKGYEMVFSDDVSLVEAKIPMQLAIPRPLPVISEDELLIFYNCRVFKASQFKKGRHMIKIYKSTFSLEEAETPKQQEDKYLSDPAVKKLKELFISECVDSSPVPAHAVASALTEKINEAYASLLNPPSVKAPGKGEITLLKEKSALAHLPESVSALLIDGKIYTLSTMHDYIFTTVQKHLEQIKAKNPCFNSDLANYMHPDFHKALEEKSQALSPEEFYQFMEDSKEMIERHVLALIRNKIWHSERSFKMFIDGVYLIPEYKESDAALRNNYAKLLERRIKLDAAKEMKP